MLLTRVCVGGGAVRVRGHGRVTRWRQWGTEVCAGWRPMGVGEDFRGLATFVKIAVFD